MVCLSQWIKDNPINHKVIITDDKDNLNKLILRLNQSGSSVLNLHIISIDEAIRDSYIEKMSQKGIYAIRKMDREMSILLLQQLIEPYHFVPKQCYSKQTFVEVFRIINLLRSEKLSSQFDQSKEMMELKSLINDYESYLEENNIVDEILLAKKALALGVNPIETNSALMMFNDCCDLYKKFINLRYPSSIELELENNNPEMSFYSCYGIYNEIYRVIDKISQKQLPYGKVEILYSNHSYDALLSALFNEKQIPHRFISGKSMKDSFVLQMCEILLNWIKNDYQYKDLENLFTHSMISVGNGDDYYKGINNSIRYGYQRYLMDDLWKADHGLENQEMIEMLKRMASSFSMYQREVLLQSFFNEIISYVDELCVSYPQKEADLIKLKNLSNSFSLINVSMKIDQAIDYLLERLDALTSSESESRDAVSFICLNNKVRVLNREYTFVLGLSDNSFTVSTVQSPVLNDAQLASYLPECNCLAKNNEMNHQRCYDLSLTSSLHPIEISYPSFDENASAVQSISAYMLKILGNQKIDESTNHYPFVSEDYIVEASVEPLQKKERDEIHIYLSPSALNTICECKLRFYYNKERYLSEIQQYEKNETYWLEANQRGDLVHGVFEDYMNLKIKDHDGISKNLDQKCFDEVFEKRAQKALLLAPVASKNIYDREVKDMKKYAQNYLKQVHQQFSSEDNQWKVLACEKDIKDYNSTYPIVDEETGRKLIIHFTGIVDRIDYKEENGRRIIRIVDYKTGKKKNQQDKVKSKHTVQHEIYNYALSRNEGQVESFSYVFPFEKKNGDPIVITEFEGLPNDVIEALKDVYFRDDIIPEKTDCTYCRYQNVCMKKTALEQQEAQDE